jgi:3'(2'), 5'-bisphosphate nucleotidase
VDISQTIAGTAVEDILAIARTLGWGASKILRSYYRGEAGQAELEIQDKKDGPVTAADLAVNHYILEKLQSALGDEDFGYLSEETYKASTSTFPQPWVWVIDPLDGTRDFIDKTGEYAFHLALTHRGRPILTVVACPELEKLYYAVLGNGAYLETPDGTTTRIQVSDRNNPEELSVVASRTHRDERFNNLLKNLPCQNLVYAGSVGGKIAAIVDHRADVYISLSGKSAPKDWDMAAPELILTEAGGKFTHADGTPLCYNTGDVNQWGCLIASNGHCHDVLCTEAERILAELDQQ